MKWQVKPVNWIYRALKSPIYSRNVHQNRIITPIVAVGRNCLIWITSSLVLTRSNQMKRNQQILTASMKYLKPTISRLMLSSKPRFQKPQTAVSNVTRLACLAISAD